MSGIAFQEPGKLMAACAVCGLFHLLGTPCPLMAALAGRSAGRELAPGTVLGGRFELIEVVHRSGMSTIYRARQRGDGIGTVALKHISVRGRSPDEQAETRGWLAREAGQLSSLDHPFLPDLIAAFSEGNDHYVVMPCQKQRP